MSIEVKLELGHKAAMKDKPTPEGFTHDWTVFVRGCEGSNIVHFVDKVVFHLHESFPKPKRVVKEPPYQVSESGYAGFIMPIEVYFRSKEEPKKVRFEYDLFLRLEGSPVYNMRLEKLTFQNPSDDFRRKLVKARSEKASQAATGGEVRQVPTAAIAPIQHTPDEPRPQQQQLQPPHAKVLPAIAEKRPKSHSSAKEPSKPPAPPVKPASQPFENIFGTPIKTKSSPDPSVKNKDTSISNHQKPQKTLQPAPPPPVIAPVKEVKTVLKEPETKESKVKPPKTEKEIKAGTKRPLTPEVTNHHSNSSVSAPTLEKKRKHATSSGGTNKKTLDSNSNKTEKTKEKKEKVKSKSSSSSSSSSLTSKKDKHKTSSHSKSANGNTSQKLPSPPPPDVFSQSQNADSNSTKPFLKSEDSSSNTPHSSAPVLSPVEKSLSPPTQELDNDFLTLSSDEDNIASARSKEKLQNSSAGGGSSNNHSDDFENSSSNHAFPDRPSSRASAKSNSSMKPKKSPTKNHKTNAKHSNSSSPAAVVKENHVNSPSSSTADSPKSPKPPAKTLDSDYHQELVDLQKRIMAINDQHQLQKIVDVIEKTGKFSITTSSFDFDLCSLDIGTVRQLKNCLSM